MRRLLRRLERAASSPPVMVGVGVILIATSVFDLLDTAFERFLGVEIGVEHGVLFWGVVHVVRGLSGMLERVADLQEGLEDIGKGTGPMPDD